MTELPSVCLTLPSDWWEHIHSLGGSNTMLGMGYNKCLNRRWLEFQPSWRRFNCSERNQPYMPLIYSGIGLWPSWARCSSMWWHISRYCLEMVNWGPISVRLPTHFHEWNCFGFPGKTFVLGDRDDSIILFILFDSSWTVVTFWITYQGWELWLDSLAVLLLGSVGLYTAI